MSGVNELNQLSENLKSLLGDKLAEIELNHDEITVEIAKENWLEVAKTLRDEDDLRFEQLIDLCGVDYQAYGLSEWEVDDATACGFSRATEKDQAKSSWSKPRFAVVYHLLSITNNWRLRVKVFVDDEPDNVLTSVTSIWNSAQWYEREAFDLYGIVFDGHNDLRRILTDYGFVGHPFRKDFPLIGNVEMRYDAKAGRCIYEPVSIEPRVLVPRVIRSTQAVEGESETKEEKHG